MFARSRRQQRSEEACWYLIDLVTKSATQFRVDVRVDAVFAATREDAVAISESRMPVRCNQSLTAYAAMTPFQIEEAQRVFRLRNHYNNEFEQFMNGCSVH